jgi:hypothetical protein
MRFPALLLLSCAPAFAQFYTPSQPDAQYTSGTTLVPISASNGTLVPSSISGAGQLLSFSTSMTAYNAGIGAGLFNPWGTAPDVEATSLKILSTNALNQTSLTISLDTPANTFGFELAPINVCTPFPACAAPPFPVSTFDVTVQFYNNATLLGSVTHSPTYISAKLFAASSGTKITRAVITAPATAGGFGVGQFRFGQTVLAPVVSSVPALGLPQLGGLGLLLAAAGALLARRSAIAA